MWTFCNRAIQSGSATIGFPELCVCDVLKWLWDRLQILIICPRVSAGDLDRNFFPSSEAIEHILSSKWGLSNSFQVQRLGSLHFHSVFNAVKITIHTYNFVYNLARRLSSGNVRQVIGLFCLRYFQWVSELLFNISFLVCYYHFSEWKTFNNF